MFIYVYFYVFSTLPVVYLTVQLTALTHLCLCHGDSRRQLRYIPSPYVIPQSALVNVKLTFL